MIFGIDFDNTISTHAYPFTGDLVPYAKEVIALLQKNGHKCMMWTVRGHDAINVRGSKDEMGTYDALLNAQVFCLNNGIVFNYFNESPMHPSSSHKQYVDYYIDDVNIGTPLMNYRGHRVVDWLKVAELLAEIGALTQEDIDSIDRSSVRGEERIEALTYCVGARSGKTSELIGMIGNRLVDEFNSVGFISATKGGNWKVLRLGEDYLKEFKK